MIVLIVYLLNLKQPPPPQKKRRSTPHFQSKTGWHRLQCFVWCDLCQLPLLGCLLFHLKKYQKNGTSVLDLQIKAAWQAGSAVKLLRNNCENAQPCNQKQQQKQKLNKQARHMPKKSQHHPYCFMWCDQLGCFDGSTWSSWRNTKCKRMEEASVFPTNPVNVPDPIYIGSRSAGKHWPEAGRMNLAQCLAFGLDPFGWNLTQSARTKSDLGWFCTVLSGTSVEERNWDWKWEAGSRPMIPVHWFASTQDVFGQTPTRPSRSDPGQFCTVWSMDDFFGKMELKQIWEVGSGIHNLAWFWLHADHNGHNWL